MGKGNRWCEGGKHMATKRFGSRTNRASGGPGRKQEGTKKQLLTGEVMYYRWKIIRNGEFVTMTNWIQDPEEPEKSTRICLF